MLKTVKKANQLLLFINSGRPVQVSIEQHEEKGFFQSHNWFTDKSAKQRSSPIVKEKSDRAVGLVEGQG